MLKRIENYMVCAYDELNIDTKTGKAYHLIEVIRFNKDNTYEQKYLYYEGAISLFKNMSDLHLVRTIEKLLTKNNYDKFTLNFEISVDIS